MSRGVRSGELKVKHLSQDINIIDMCHKMIHKISVITKMRTNNLDINAKYAQILHIVRIFNRNNSFLQGG
jgi:hypothetical protein